MTEVKAVAHTPGPWFADIQPRIGNHAGSFSVEVDGMVICGRHGVPTRASESAANARLIAAAPELLAALVAITEAYTNLLLEGGFSITDEVSKVADAAIAKAEGTTP